MSRQHIFACTPNSIKTRQEFVMPDGVLIEKDLVDDETPVRHNLIAKGVMNDN